MRSRRQKSFMGVRPAHPNLYQFPDFGYTFSRLAKCIIGLINHPDTFQEYDFSYRQNRFQYYFKFSAKRERG